MHRPSFWLAVGVLIVGAAAIGLAGHSWQISLLRIVLAGALGSQPSWRNVAGRNGTTGAEAVFVPSVSHFESGEVPAELVRAADVITVDDRHTYARWSTGELPELGAMNSVPDR
ncbi:hypothetical protein [Nocardia sp. IFM 10818]